MKYPRIPIQIKDYLNFKVLECVIKPNIISRIFKKFRRTRMEYCLYLVNERYGNVVKENQLFGFRKVLQKRKFKNVFFDGYFQDFRYIEGGINRLMLAFINLITIENISYDNYIAIHIRRGDYGQIARDY